ncbi:hypothetical protein [Streptosporangium minutum]|nr:hypothetical protein [Streptosporangium minutum]
MLPSVRPSKGGLLAQVINTGLDHHLNAAGAGVRITTNPLCIIFRGT